MGERFRTDVGWAWVVCLTCSVVHVIVDGNYYSFGLTVIQLSEYFNTKKGETAAVFSIMMGITCLIGPITAILVNRYGCRAVCVAGSLLYSASFVMSVFAPSIYFLYFSFGVIGAMGYGMCYFPTIVAVNQYFDRWRALATGIGVGGSGIGIFIFGPVVAMLLSVYTWKGTFLIQGGFALNIFACGLLLRPIQQNHSEETQRVVENKQNRQEFAQSMLDNKPELAQTLIDNKHVSDAALIYATSDNHDDMVETDEMLQTSYKDSYSTNSIAHKTSEESQMPVAFREPCKADSQNTNLNTFNVLSSQVSLSSKISVKDINKKKIINFKIFKKVQYVIFLISTFLVGLGFGIPYIYLPDSALRKGLDTSQTAWLISTIGICNVVGRVGFGFLADVPGVNRLLLYSLTIVIYGAGTMFLSLYDSFISFLLYAIVFGTFGGVTMSIRFVVVADLVGMDDLTDALGINAMFFGISSTVGSPFAGWLYDVTQTYVATYAFGGVCLFVGGAVLLVIPCLPKKGARSDILVPETDFQRHHPDVMETNTLSS